MSGTIPTTNVSFSNLVSTYNNINDPDLSTTNIALSNFRNKEFSSGSAVPSSGAISIGTDFKGRTWKAPITGPSGWIAVTNSTSRNPATTTSIVNIWYKRSVVKFTYSQALLNSKGITSGSVIKKIKFTISGDLITNDYEASQYGSYNNGPPGQDLRNYQIAMKNQTGGASTNPGNSSWTTVYNTTLSGSANGEQIFDITDFPYTGNNLCFSFSWQNVNNYKQRGRNYTFNDPGNAYAWYSRTDAGGTYYPTSSASVEIHTNVPRVDMFF